MRILLYSFLFFLASCSAESRPAQGNQRQISATQNSIQSLVDNFKREYVAANSPALRDSVIKKYNQKFFAYLGNNFMDSVRVHVDSVMVNDLTVTTQFHCNKNIAFRYGLTFKGNMNPLLDSLFNFMKGLQPGSDTMLNFEYTGAYELSNPADTSRPTLRIFAFPLPLYLKNRL